MKDQYTLTPKRESGRDCDEIISLLSEYQALDRPITVMNYYLELPVTTKSTLSRFDSGKFEITVAGMHTQVILQQMQTIVKLEGCTALADCSSVNYQKQRLVIANFRYIELQAAKREAFRLNVNASLIIDFRSEQGKIAARMVDISLTGCRVIIEHEDVPVGTFAVLESNFLIQGKEVRRNLPAKVVKSYHSDNFNYCCLEFIGTPSDQDLLHRYLSQEQAGIIRKFREM
jgi:hypothetical protein